VSDNFSYNHSMSKFKLLFFISLLFVNISYALAEPYVDKELLERIGEEYKVFAKKRFFFQQKTFDSLKDSSDFEKLDAVNKFYNDVRYSSDQSTYGMSDYWATPYEFLGRDKGDCEDYVIAKYFALQYLGMDMKKLFFFYVKSTKFKEAHMVLAYYEKPSAMPLILDNNNFKVLAADKRKDLQPIYRLQAGQVEKISTGKKVKSEKVGRQWDQLIKNIERKKI
jgi:predicted transglutaminase-like cysteine proteinase